MQAQKPPSQTIRKSTFQTEILGTKSEKFLQLKAIFFSALPSRQENSVFVSHPNHSTPIAPPRVAALTLTIASIQSSLIPYSYAKPL